MTKTAEAGELAKHLSKFLDDVKAGHEVVVTRDATPIARLVPVQKKSKRQSRSIRHVRPLSGKWIGETILKSSDLADEMFARE